MSEDNEEDTQEESKEETSQTFDCPHCGEPQTEFPQYGKSPAPLCENCSKLVSKKDIPEEMIVKKEKKTKGKDPADDEDVKRILEEEASEEIDMELDESNFFEEPKKPEEVLAQVLSEFDVDKNFIKMMVRRSKRQGGIHPSDLRNYLKAMKSGINNESECDYIADEYSFALREEEEKAKNTPNASPEYPLGKRHRQSYSSGSGMSQYGTRDQSYQRSRYDQRSNMRQRDRNQQYGDYGDSQTHGGQKIPQQSTPGGDQKSYEINRLQSKIDRMMDEMDSEDLTKKEIRDIVIETVSDTKKEKKQEISPEDVQQMIQNSIQDMQKQNRIEKLESELRETQSRMQQQQQEFQNMLTETVSEMKDMIVEASRPSDDVVTKDDLERERKERESEMLKEMMKIKEKNQEKQLEELKKDRELLLNQLEKERESLNRPPPSADGEWTSDEAKITADAINRAADLAEKKEPVRNILTGLKELTKDEEGKPKIETLKEPEDSQGGVAELMDEEYIEG